MQRVVGSILVILACSGIGLSKSVEMKAHLKELEAIKQLFIMLKSELVYTKAPFSEVFEKIGTKIKGRYGNWLIKIAESLEKKEHYSFNEVWKGAIETELGDSFLKKSELEELKQVGQNLEYIESINLYLEQLEYSIQNTREEYRTKKKLCQSMGIMGGIFLVILLL